jgi:hypothetical protein
MQFLYTMTVIALEWSFSSRAQFRFQMRVLKKKRRRGKWINGGFFK